MLYRRNHGFIFLARDIEQLRHQMARARYAGLKLVKLAARFARLDMLAQILQLERDGGDRRAQLVRGILDD